MSPIQGIDLFFEADLIIRQRDNQSIVVRAQENIIEHLNKTTDQGIWTIAPSEGCLESSEKVGIEINLPSLRTLISNSASDIIFTEPLHSQNAFQAEINNKGNILMSGSTENCKIISTGTGDFGNMDFVCQNAVIEVSGSGDVELTVQQSLRVEISGSGNVRIKGDPSSVVPILTGTGRLIKL